MLSCSGAAAAAWIGSGSGSAGCRASSAGSAAAHAGSKAHAAGRGGHSRNAQEAVQNGGEEEAKEGNRAIPAQLKGTQIKRRRRWEAEQASELPPMRGSAAGRAPRGLRGGGRRGLGGSSIQWRRRSRRQLCRRRAAGAEGEGAAAAHRGIRFPHSRVRCARVKMVLVHERHARPDAHGGGSRAGGCGAE